MTDDFLAGSRCYVGRACEVPIFTPMLFLRFLVTAVCLQALQVSAQNPPKLATGARFDLLADAGVGSINNAVVLKGNMQRMNWIAAQDQPRSYTCNFSVIHFGWTEILVQFTPENSGTVQLSVMGPWEQSTEPGTPIYKQELLWDALGATNSTILNPSFESVTGTMPNSWSRYGSDAAADAGPVEPVDGSRYARTWHNSPLQQNIPVTAGQTVTLRFFTRPQLPAGFTDMKRITDPNSEAHQARLKLMRGVNLGNYLEAPVGQNWGQTYTTADFIQIKAEGFDRVRLPARWNDYPGVGPDFESDEAFAAKVDDLVTNALNNGLSAIVNIHHFDDFTTDPAAETEKFYKLSEQIADRYANQPDEVVFELLNEPKDAATTTVLNPIYAEAISRIRLTNPNRTILVGPGQFNSIEQLSALRLPDNDTNLIVTVHSYAPFYFTHQGATWTGDQTSTTGDAIKPDTTVVFNLLGRRLVRSIQHAADRAEPVEQVCVRGQPRSGEDVVGLLRSARSCRRVRVLRTRGCGVARPVLSRQARGHEPARHWLGNMGLESGFQVLGCKSKLTGPRSARSEFSADEFEPNGHDGVSIGGRDWKANPRSTANRSWRGW
jgi:endoglucanase